MKKKLAIALSLLLIAATFGACGPTSSVSLTSKEEAAPAGTETAGQTEAETKQAPASDEAIELTMWDLRTEGASAQMIDTLIAKFMEENPNITIKRTAFKVADLRNTIKPAINSGEGPDVFSYDAGAGYLGVLANAGLAMDMTPYAEQFQWNDRFHDWALEKTNYNGKLYGIANELEMLGVFYNKQMFADAAMKFVDFMFSEASMETWYEAGLIPSVKDVDYSSYDVKPLFKDVVDEINNSENLGENIDVLMPPKVNDVTQNYVQELIAGKRDGAACMEKKQKAFEEEITAGNYTVN